MNVNLLKRKLDFVSKNLVLMQEILKDYKTGKEVYFLALKRVAEEIVESAIKINFFLLNSKSKFAKSYRDSFLDLNCFEDFESDFLEEISKTAHFRNILAHEYVELTEEDVIDNIKKILELYPKYLKIVLKISKSMK